MKRLNDTSFLRISGAAENEINNKQSQVSKSRPLSKRQQRRQLYGIVQELYKKNRTRRAKTVLCGRWTRKPVDQPNKSTTQADHAAYAPAHPVTNMASADHAGLLPE